MADRIDIILTLAFSAFFVWHLVRRASRNFTTSDAPELIPAARANRRDDLPEIEGERPEFEGLLNDEDDEDDETAPDSVLPENLDELIAIFNSRGSVTFHFGRDNAAYELFMGFIRRQAVPTYTTVDEEEGAVTIHRRLMGSME